MSSFKHSKISHILMFYILLFSSFVTLVTTSYTIYFEYTQDIENIESAINQIEKSYIASISNSLWQFDSGQLKTLLRGISEVPSIAYVGVVTNGETVLEVGQALKKNMIKRVYPLGINQNLRNKKYVDLGEMTIIASLEGVYSRLKTRVLVILATQTVKTFLVTLFIYLIVMRLITYRLWKLTRYLMNPNINGNDLNIKRLNSREDDELDIVAKSIVDYQKNLEQTHAELRGKEESLRKLSIKLISSQEEERARISRDLHDDIGQKLAVLKLTFANKFKKPGLDAETFEAHRKDIFTEVDGLVSGIRGVAKRLSPTILYSFGLVDALRWLFEESFKNSEIEYIIEGDELIDSKDIDLNLTIFRIVQESINNILKHANASLVELTIAVEAGHIKMLVRDDGVGIKGKDLEKMTSTGVVGIKERLRLFNGTFTIRNCKELGGAELLVLIPWEKNS